MTNADLRRRLSVLSMRATDVAAEVDADEEYWSLVATGQDTQEAEASAAMVGYLDALRFAIDLFSDVPLSEERLAEWERYGNEARERLAEYRTPRRSDSEALDELNLLLSAPEWPGASGMEDVFMIVRSTGRKEVPNAPHWESH